jgi:hypothetical protein
LCDRWAFLLDARNASSATQKHKHLLKSRRVQNTLFGHPALARDGDAPLHEIKLRDRVRIGIDAEHAAKFERLADQATWRMLGSKLRDLMPVNVEEAWRWRQGARCREGAHPIPPRSDRCTAFQIEGPRTRLTPLFALFYGPHWARSKLLQLRHSLEGNLAGLIRRGISID